MDSLPLPERWTTVNMPTVRSSTYQISSLGRVRNRYRTTLGNVDSHGYAGVCLLGPLGEKRKYKVHRLVALHFLPNPRAYTEVDHIDRVRSNNHLGNLRWASRQLNCHNRRKAPEMSSAYRGVSWHVKSQKWQAGIRINLKMVYLGIYADERDAAEAYNAAALAWYGDDACLNELS